MLTACLRTMTGCLVLALLMGSGVSRAQNALLGVDPADGVFDGPSLLGTSAAITDTAAAVGGPNISAPIPDNSPQEHFYWQGAVNVYTTNGTAWTLETVLHAEDDDPIDQAFGVGVALRDRQLIVASTGALWVYERRKQGWEETDKLNLPNGESIPEFGSFTLGPMQLYYENGVLAFKVAEQGAGPVVVIYKVDHNGQLRRIAKLTAPNDPQHVGFTGDLSLDRDGDLIAVGVPGNTAQSPGSVYFYESRGNRWHLKQTLAAPGPEAVGFGSGVALHGRTLIVGAPYEGSFIDPIFNSQVPAGAAHVYRREDNRWVQVQLLDSTNLPAPGGFSGLSTFGKAIATNGRFVIINAPQDPENCASCIPGGFSSVFQWVNGQLVYVPAASDSFITVGGGLDMSRRYVIVGNDEQNFGNNAAILDLTTLAPASAGADEQPED